MSLSRPPSQLSYTSDHRMPAPRTPSGSRRLTFGRPKSRQSASPELDDEGDVTITLENTQHINFTPRRGRASHNRTVSTSSSSPPAAAAAAATSTTPATGHDQGAGNCGPHSVGEREHATYLTPQSRRGHEPPARVGETGRRWAFTGSAALLCVRGHAHHGQGTQGCDCDVAGLVAAGRLATPCRSRALLRARFARAREGADGSRNTTAFMVSYGMVFVRPVFGSLICNARRLLQGRLAGVSRWG